jgi:hypothetical protein
LIRDLPPANFALDFLHPLPFQNMRRFALFFGTGARRSLLQQRNPHTWAAASDMIEGSGLRWRSEESYFPAASEISASGDKDAIFLDELIVGKP